MSYHAILDVSALAGKIMLENGGEVYRVEETITHVCKALGAASCESYASPTAIMITITDSEGGIYSIMRRIHTRRVNLNKVDEVNRFSRTLEREAHSLEETRRMLEEIDNKPSYSLKIVLLASAVITGSFAFVFGGGLRDSISAFMAGGILRFVAVNLQRIRLNEFFVNIIGGMSAVFLGWLAVACGLGKSWDIITISVLMLLVPGLLITNGIRDIAAGDLVSGTSRTIEALFVAVALACGAGFVYTLLTQAGGGLV